MVNLLSFKIRGIIAFIFVKGPIIINVSSLQSSPSISTRRTKSSALKPSQREMEHKRDQPNLSLNLDSDQARLCELRYKQELKRQIL